MALVRVPGDPLFPCRSHMKLLAVPTERLSLCATQAPCVSRCNQIACVADHAASDHSIPASPSATTKDHHGASLAPKIAFQYQAETSGQPAPLSSRITSHTVNLSSRFVARKQPIAIPVASLRAGIGVML